jgi:hypothetical protein
MYFTLMYEISSCSNNNAKWNINFNILNFFWKIQIIIIFFVYTNNMLQNNTLNDHLYVNHTLEPILNSQKTFRVHYQYQSPEVFYGSNRCERYFFWEEQISSTSRQKPEITHGIRFVLINPVPDQEGNKSKRQKILSFIYILLIIIIGGILVLFIYIYI